MRKTLLALALTGTSLVAQEARPTFEVASIRPQTRPFSFADDLARGGPRPRPGGAFAGTHATVASLIRFAYDLKDYQVTGGPEWVGQSYFDINARAKSPEASVEQIRLMVQSLLEDRFGLVAHTEQREMRYVALVLARRDGQLGPFLLPVDGECDREKSVAMREKLPARPAMRGGALGGCTDLQDLADLISAPLKTPVIDRTGLHGKFVYDARIGTFSLQPGASLEPADPALPPLNVALEEQLGLRLQDERGPIDILVIDSVQQPTAN